MRADASPAMGTGHVMRCLALAEALQDRGVRVVFAMAAGSPAMDARVAGAGFTVHRTPSPAGGPADLAATRGLLDAEGARALVLDGYHFDTDFRTGLRTPGRPVLVFDDLADRPAFHADLVVNPALQADRELYARIAPGARLLLGPAYAALRREIRTAAAAPRPDPVERRAVLVTFGGADPPGLTAPCLAALAERLPVSCRLLAVVGGANPRAAEVRAVAARLGDRAEVHVDTPSMGALMAQAGLAVSAGGGTTGELAALGVPMLLVVIADNQAPAAARAAAAGLAAVVDARSDAPGAAVAAITAQARHLWDDPQRRGAMAARAAAAVDAQGAPRIADALIAAMGAGHSS
ncbi:UDP-2,4-diacetamido-2,4,6-trideoxy-beta-L-altropyranose hydrolase [Azospirillum halopraeferens]|uniref:UDP-2,4-diacetamido-2,4, 6-trideoxy-beta-L-altropyranose hydrolase n=1 Tax=Azospirillum halopraeferens TaxID=34010 RepID=UPI001FE1C9FC|nr:UDP-2,4-diacetamido-2,4,6-trideoxy-beta-L-altropyranose hydrolase [Azospirillum halopraeferens]